MAGVDGSDFALLAVEFAFAAAASRGTGLRVVRAAEPPPARWRPASFDAEAQIAAERAETTELVSGWREKHPQVPASVHIAAGPPAQALVDASGDAGLVVVGSRGRAAFEACCWAR